MAPAGTPRSIVDRVAADIKAIYSTDEVRKKLFDIGAVASPNTPDAFAALAKADRAKYDEVVRQIGLEKM
jgi:tripartite-type tricarboxylate transporter receptor subunit TctC